jgi:hypothetical protein
MDKLKETMDKPREDFDHWLDNFEYGTHGRNLRGHHMNYDSYSDYTQTVNGKVTKHEHKHKQYHNGYQTESS